MFVRSAHRTLLPGICFVLLLAGDVQVTGEGDSVKTQVRAFVPPRQGMSFPNGAAALDMLSRPQAA
jgi:hypothetical protein